MSISGDIVEVNNRIIYNRLKDFKNFNINIFKDISEVAMDKNKYYIFFDGDFSIYNIKDSLRRIYKNPNLTEKKTDLIVAEISKNQALYLMRNSKNKNDKIY